MPTIDAMVAQIEKTLLVLAQPIVVLTGRGVEGGGNTVAWICLLLVIALPREPLPDGWET